MRTYDQSLHDIFNRVLRDPEVAPNELVMEAMKRAREGEPTENGLPQLPWNWEAAGSPSGNGAYHIYLVDATGRKIAAIWGKGAEKQAMAEHIVGLVNGGAS